MQLTKAFRNPFILLLILVPHSVLAGKRCNDLTTRGDGEIASLVRAFRDESLLEGDLQYLMAPASGSGGVVDLVRVVGFEEEKGIKSAVILYPDGSLLLRNEDWIRKARPSLEAKSLWLGFDHEGSLLLAKKEVSELPLKREQWVARALGLESVPPLDRSAARTIRIDESEGKALDASAGTGPIARVGEELKKKMSVTLTAIEPVEAEYLAVYRGDATIIDENGAVHLEQKVIQMKNELLESGRVTDTLLHEIGHVKTFKDLSRGVPDPLGVAFQALSDKKPLPDGTHYEINDEEDFYSQFSSADESRQYALNLRNALHQRATSDVIRDFSVTSSIPASKVYGYNLQNFFEMGTEALDRLEDLRIFNRRNRELAMKAIKKIEKALENPGSLKFSDFDVFSKLDNEPALFEIRTTGAFVQVPVVGEAYDRILAPIESHSDGEVYFNFVLRRESMLEIFSYSLEYLRNLVHSMERQSMHIEKVSPLVIDLIMHPSKPVTLRNYLKLQSEVAKVRTSIAVRPEWLGKLRVMIE